MKILQEVQKSFNSIGFSPNLDRFNKKILIVTSVIVVGLILQLIYIFHEADTPQEYMESIHFFSACFSILLSFASSVLMKQKLFSFIKQIEDHLKISE